MEGIYYYSPIGCILIKSRNGKITYLGFSDDDICHTNTEKPKNGILAECVSQLEKYFDGKLKVFDLPLSLGGTEFQAKVWDALTKIPYGETCSYKDIAISIGKEKAMRAVGGANNRNPVSIIVPCHRVIAVGGALSGYGGGVWRKERLLELEAKYRV